MTTDCFWVLMKDLWNKKRIDLWRFSTRLCNDVITMQPSLPHTSCCGRLPADCPTWSAGGSLTLWQTGSSMWDRAEPSRTTSGLTVLLSLRRPPSPPRASLSSAGLPLSSAAAQTTDSSLPIRPATQLQVCHRPHVNRLQLSRVYLSVTPADDEPHVLLLKPTVSLSFSKLYINDQVQGQVTLIDLKKRIFIEFTL